MRRIDLSETKKIAVNASFLLRQTAGRGVADMVREAWSFL